MFLEKTIYKKVMESVPIVCVDALIINEKGEYLLVKRKNNPLKNKFWMIGGRLHKDEHTKEGIKRKIKEEVGLNITSVKFLGHFEAFFKKTEQNIKGKFHSISFVYLAFVDSKAKICVDKQSSDYKWVKKLPSIFNKHVPWLVNNGPIKV